MNPIKPYRLKAGDTIGIFTPSWPAHCFFREKFEFAIRQIENLGFKVKLGSLTKTFSHEGYRTANAALRAREFMELIEDPGVHALMSTIGGSISNGMLEYLDYDSIREARKPIIGYSDVTSLLLAIHCRSNLIVFYGPAVVPSMGEHPKPLDLTVNSFLDATTRTDSKNRILSPPSTWSNQLRSAFSDEWKTGARMFQKNFGWETLNKGQAEGLGIVANLNTLSSCLGTPFIPSFKNKILFLEQMLMDLEREERQLRQLRLAGVFNEIAGLVISKPENLEKTNATYDPKDLYKEVIEERPYPIVWNFDCGHTHPSITIPIGTPISIVAEKHVEIKIMGPSVESP